MSMRDRGDNASKMPNGRPDTYKIINTRQELHIL